MSRGLRDRLERVQGDVTELDARSRRGIDTTRLEQEYRPVIAALAERVAVSAPHVLMLERRLGSATTTLRQALRPPREGLRELVGLTLGFFAALVVIGATLTVFDEGLLFHALAATLLAGSVIAVARWNARLAGC